MSGSIVTRIEARGSQRVAFVTIDRDEKLNALSSPLMTDFVAAIDACAADVDLHAIIVTGVGTRAFVGGADISEMAGLDPARARAFITRVHGCCDAVRRAPMPVIARVNGHAFGAGMELAACCDLRISADHARWGMPEVRLGIPSVVEAAILPKLVGFGRAREMVLLGETFSAAEALAWNLVERVVPADALDAEVERVLESLLACGLLAVRAQKALAKVWEDASVPDAVQAGIDTFAAAFETGEPEQMMGHFLKAQAARKKS